MASSRCANPNLRGSWGQDSRMAWVGAATRKGLVVDSSGWLSASTRAISRRLMRVLPNPMATATPASRCPLTTARIWSYRACFLAWAGEKAPAGKALISKEAGLKQSRSESNCSNWLLCISHVTTARLNEQGPADRHLSGPQRAANARIKTPTIAR